MLYLRHLIICGLLLRRGFPLRTLGESSIGCSWTFCPDGLGPESVVYSGGVGNDISFERALVREFGCPVHLLDPSPTGLATMNLPQNRIPQFRFLPVALAGSPGTLLLAPPLYGDEGSWRSAGAAPGTIQVPCQDLATLLQ